MEHVLLKIICPLLGQILKDALALEALEALEVLEALEAFIFQNIFVNCTSKDMHAWN